MRHRDAAYALLTGSGLEIGAMSAPADLSKDVDVHYCDVLDKDEALRRFPELEPSRLIDVDHVLDLDTEGLSRFATSSQDFVIANHVIAHVANPIRFLGELFRVVRPGGYVVLSTGDKTHTFDRGRAETAFELVLAKYRDGATQLSDEHYLDFLAGVHPEVFAMPVAEIIKTLGRVRARRETAYVWSCTGFQAFLQQAMQLLGVEADCVYERNGEETHYEYFSAWQVVKPCTLNPPVRPAPIFGAVAMPADRPSGNVVVESVQAQPILLCGMHRSGTSVLAHCLKSIGVWLGDDEAMLPAHAEDNPEGYWERRDVHDAHVQFLAESGFDWDRLAGYSAVDPSSPSATALTEQLTSVVSDLGGHATWALKDPRLCLVLPVWQRVAPDFIPIVAVRHPLEVAASLLRSPRGIYPTHFTLLLWEKYLLRCLKDLAGRRALFVSYRNLITSPKAEIERIARILQANGVHRLRQPSDSELASVVKKNLRRNRRELDDGGALSRQQTDLLERLLAAAEKDRTVSIDVDACQEPDAELAEFEAAFDSRVERVHHQLRASAAEQGRLSEAILSKVHDNQLRLHQENAKLQRKVLSLKHTSTDLKARVRDAQGQLKTERANHEKQVGDLSRHAQYLERSLASYAGSWSWKATAPLRWMGGLFSLKGGAEQRLYRLYYRLPFLSTERKRRLVIWVHERLPFLTRGTVSYAMYQGSRGVEACESSGPLVPRMDAGKASALIGQFPQKPRVSIVMPTWNTDPRWLQEAYDSLRAQFYPHWQLCIADDASTRRETLAWLRNIDDERVRVAFLETNVGIAEASNAALALADGDYVGLLDHDDLLSADALLESVRALVEGGYDIVYSDEDKIDESKRHFDPNFKPDYSPDMLLSQNYICHFLVVRRALLDEVGRFRKGFDGSQDHDLLLRLSERSQRIRRIPKVLYHWRVHAASTAADPNAKPASWQAGLNAVAEAMRRREIEGAAEFGRYPHTYRVKRAIAGTPLVSIIVPFRDKPDLLETCVRSVLEKTAYSHYELLCVDNGSVERETHALLEALQELDSRVRVVVYDKPFNYSAINNFAVRHVAGEHLLFLNNDTEVVAPQWLEAMLEHSQRPDVGVVGAQLMYDDGTLQHAGVIAGLGGVAGHAHLNVRADAPGYFCRAQLIQDLSAVTFACAMSRRDVFDQVGGLNEADLRIAFNDVDYCFRARELGYRVIYTPYAQLYHYESKSRGYEDSPEKQARFGKEIRYMQQRHKALIEGGDPFYNPNFRIDCESFTFQRNYYQELP